MDKKFHLTNKRYEFKFQNYELQHPDDRWYAWKSFYLQKDVSFVSDELNFLFATEMEQTVSRFVDWVVNYLSDWKKVIDSQQNSSS